MILYNIIDYKKNTEEVIVIENNLLLFQIG